MSFLSWITGTDKYGAAQSVLIAKYTFSKLTENDKDRVKATAYRVLEAGGYPPDSIDVCIAKLSEDQRYCLYSTAMAVAGIKPALKGVLHMDEWYPIPNPFVALTNAATQIKTAQFEIKRKHNIQIDLEYY